MEKLKMHSPDFTDKNIAKLAELFPNCVTEACDEDGVPKMAVDFDLLRQELSTSAIEGPRERYQLTWPGKNEALLTANAPIAKTLRPCPEESVDFDVTQNLFVEGDNLDALKLLQETYLNKVKMIYIDPPYNTGNDFVYNDDFKENTDLYFLRSNQVDNAGNRLVSNNDTNGRFHSDWLTMVYPRLKLARNLLKDDGVFFVSIDDNEFPNLKRVCDEIFGEQNFISSISRMMKSGGAKGRFFTPNVDFVLVYAKNINYAKHFRSKITQEQIEGYYNKVEQEGPRKGELFGEERIYKASLDARPNQRYWIECPDGSFVIPPGVNFPEKVEHGAKIIPAAEDGVWKWIFDRYQQEYKEGHIIFKQTNTSALVDQNGNKSKWNLYNKLWLKDQQEKGKVPSNFIGGYENRQSAAELKQLDIPFNFAKPSGLIKYLVEISRVENNDIVLDFFSGSATTAHAVMALNAESGGILRYIMVQLPEVCGEKSEAFKAGYKTIAEIGKERIRRAGKKIKEENADNEGIENLDIGFRVLKIDSSNMKDVYYTPDTITQDNLFSQTDNIREDRTPEDLLFQDLLDWGVDLSLPITQKTIAGKNVFFVDENALAACFETGVNEEFVKALAAHKPMRVVFRDASFDSDSAKINVEQIFKMLSPGTEVKTI